MSKVISFKSSRTPPPVDDAMREQAALWLARLDAGASEEDLKLVDVWLAQDARHVTAFMDMAQLWDQLSLLEELSTVFPLKEYAARKALRRRFTFSAKMFSGRMRFVFASAVVFAISTVAIVSYFGADPFSHNFQAQYRTAVGEQMTVDLDDGSQIILNTATSVVVDFSNSTRKIDLRSGEALFQVAKDASRPFQVLVGKQMVEAVGTAFSVHRKSELELEVMVTEGKVMLYRQEPASSTGNDISVGGVESERPGSQPLPLIAGQFASSSERGGVVAQLDMAPDQLETKLSWQHGMLLFRDDPLEQVLAQIARYTTQNIEAAEEIRNVRVGGYFRVNDIDALLEAIENNFEIEVERIDSNNIYLARRQADISQGQ